MLPPVRQQAEIQQQWLQLRLDRHLPKLMRKYGVKMWLVVCREYNEDPVYQSLVSPTVFGNVNHTMELMREESFGPIIGIQKVEGDAEAVALMNDTEYGLTAGVYTKDGERARGILGQVHAGSVYWNCCDRVSPRLPWSGVGESGIGLTLSTYGIETFTRPKAWHLKGE